MLLIYYKSTINKQIDLNNLHHNDILDFCFNKDLVEPTCSTGEFLLSVLDIKKYVDTKQTEYEYKHKFCIQEIQAIDDEINHLYGLTTSESEYIKNFAFQYRVNKNEL